MDKYLPIKAGTPEIISSLISEYKWLSLLKTLEKPYVPLIDYLIELGEYESLDENNHKRANYQINTISDKIGISHSKVRNWIFKMYDDLLELNAASPGLFKKDDRILHCLSFTTAYGFWNNVNVWLPIRLQINDYFNFPFIKAKVEYSHFYVSSFTVTHLYGEIVIDAHLKGGWGENSFRRLLLEKLEFTRELSFHETYDKSEFTIDARLFELMYKTKSVL